MIDRLILATNLTSEITDTWSSCCSQSGSEPSELDRENMSGVSSTNPTGGVLVWTEVALGLLACQGIDTGSVANVTAFEPVEHS